MDIDFRNDWSAYLTDTKDLLEPQLIDDDNEVKLESQYPCDEHITVTTHQSLATIMQHLGSLISYLF
jgi:hypothetical protein